MWRFFLSPLTHSLTHSAVVLLVAQLLPAAANTDWSGLFHTHDPDDNSSPRRTKVGQTPRSSNVVFLQHPGTVVLHVWSADQSRSRLKCYRSLKCGTALDPIAFILLSNVIGSIFSFSFNVPLVLNSLMLWINEFNSLSWLLLIHINLLVGIIIGGK